MQQFRFWLKNIREEWGNEDPIDYLMELGKDMLVELAFAWEGSNATQTVERREETC